MPQDYTVDDGDCMSSIGFENGFYWKTLWKHPSNAALKAKRTNPNVLMPGDIVHIPDLTIRKEPGATEQTHKFKLKGVPEIFRMKLLDSLHQPRVNVPYTIIIEGKTTKGTTDATGSLQQAIPPNATSGKLIIPTAPDKNGKPIPGRPKKQVITLQLGSLNPVTEVSGIKARLTNLGHYQGSIDDEMDDDTKRAIRSFQRRKGLPVTGVADNATRAKLLKVHGH